MLKIIATGTIVSKGFNGPAVQYNEAGNLARFKVGAKIYDKKAEGNYRYINLTVKAFGNLATKISDMKLSEGSMINFTGRLDEDSWEDKNSGETKKSFVVILEDIEYAPSSRGQSAASRPEMNQNSVSDSDNSGFTGYEPFGSESYFDE